MNTPFWSPDRQCILNLRVRRVVSVAGRLVGLHLGLGLVEMVLDVRCIAGESQGGDGFVGAVGRRADTG